MLNHARQQHVRNIGLLVASCSMLITFVIGLSGHMFVNLGFVYLNHAYENTTENSTNFASRAEEFFLLANRYSHQHHAAERGMGFVALSQGDSQQAVEHWREAEFPVSTLLAFGESAEELEKWNEALSWYALAAEIDLATSAYNLGLFLYHQQKYVEAATVWQRALNNYPAYYQRVDWWIGLADSLTVQQEWDKTIEISRTGLQEFPNSAALYTDLGRAVYNRYGDFAEAKRIMQKAVSIDPTLAEAYAAMADMLETEGEYEEAYEWYSQAVEHNPNVKWWYVQRANVARAAGDIALARRLYEEFMEQEPYYAPVYFEAAWAYYLNNQLNRAEQAIEQAIMLNDSPSANYFIRAGQIYERVVNQEKARAAYEQANKLAPNDRRILKGLERLSAE